MVNVTIDVYIRPWHSMRPEKKKHQYFMGIQVEIIGKVLLVKIILF